MAKGKKASRNKGEKISVDDALKLAVKMHQRGLVEEAKSVYDDILAAIPDHPDALHYLGVIAHQRGDSAKGIALIKKSLACNPGQPDTLNNLGNIYREQGQLEKAKEAYNKVLELAPNHADTWVNVGALLRQLSRPEAAVEKLQKAIELNPKHSDAFHNLGNALGDLKRFEEALDAYETAAKLCPDGGMSQKWIARVQYELGRKEEAIATLQRWIYASPDDAVARHLMAAYTGEGVPKQASQEFVRQSFDNFSNSFDVVLDRLNYKAPEYVGALVNEKLVATDDGYRMLDIGCGTGLCGPLIKPLASSLVGVDLSPGMLRKAAEKGVYDALEEAELTQYMLQSPGAFDAVTCVDTLCYLGDLSAAIPAAYSALDDQGWFFFTVEQHVSAQHTQGYWLQVHGRYSHMKSYLVSLLEAAGFHVNTLQDVILRREGPDDVSGLLVAAQKAGAAK